jgi:thioredoxin 2
MSDSVIIKCTNCKTKNRVLKSKFGSTPLCSSCKNKLAIYYSPIIADDKTLQPLVETSRIAVVDFFATWCGPCKIFAPVFEEFAVKYAGSANAVKIDVDANKISSSKYLIQSIPTLIVFYEGKETRRVSGALSLQSLENLILPFI